MHGIRAGPNKPQQQQQKHCAHSPAKNIPQGRQVSQVEIRICTCARRKQKLNQPVRIGSRTSDNLSNLTPWFKGRQVKQVEEIALPERLAGDNSQAPAGSSHTVSGLFPLCGSSSFPTFLPDGLLRAEVTLTHQGVRH